MNCMMAKRHRILLSVLALFLIGACSRNEEIEQQTSPSGGVEVAILCDNTKEPQVYSLPDGTRTWIDDNDWASPFGRPPTAATIRSTPSISRWPTSPPAIRPPSSARRSPICRQEPIPTRPSARCPKASAARRYLTGSRQNRRAVTKGNGIFWPPIR